jgi:hypothetical protein
MVGTKSQATATSQSELVVLNGVQLHPSIETLAKDVEKFIINLISCVIDQLVGNRRNEFHAYESQPRSDYHGVAVS